MYELSKVVVEILKSLNLAKWRNTKNHEQLADFFKVSLKKKNWNNDFIQNLTEKQLETLLPTKSPFLAENFEASFSSK